MMLTAGRAYPPGLGIVEQGGDLFSVKNAGTESGHGAVSLGLQGAKVHVTLAYPWLSHPFFKGCARVFKAGILLAPAPGRE